MKKLSVGEPIRDGERACPAHGIYPVKLIPLPGGQHIRADLCPTCLREEVEREAAAQRAKEEAERQRKIEKRLAQAGIPERFASRSFDNFVADSPEKQHALAVAKRFAQDFRRHLSSGPTLIFSGNIGTGKSHLAIAIAQAAMLQGCTAMYGNAMDVVRRLREGWRRDSHMSEAEVLDLYGSIDLLVIDEIGVQYDSESVQMHLFDVLNRRYRDNKPTILLSNLDAKGIEAYLGPRTYDRLRENGYFVVFGWESYRATARKTAGGQA